MPSDPEPRPLDPLGRQLNVTARATRDLLDAALVEAGTTFASWMVLSALAEGGPSIQKDLAARLGINGPSMAHRLDQLESAQLIARAAVASDRRASQVTLAPRGQALFEQVRTVMQATEAALVAEVDPADLATARAVLRTIADRARALRRERGAT
jgi:MarR family transcriptional regulator for hemolysin